MNSNGSASKTSSDLDPAQAPALDEEPMTEDQIGLLKALSTQANDPQAFSKTLTRAEAAGRIMMLEAAIAH